MLLTWWYGQAWEKVCERFDFEGVFDKCGSSLTADGSEDDWIKLQKLESFSFDLNDAKRLPTTGEFPETEAIEDAIVVRATDNDEEDFEEIVQDHGSAEEPIEPGEEDDDDGGETSDDELEGEDFVCPAGVEIQNTCPSGGACANMTIYYRYDSGWAKGTVKRLVEHSDNRSLNGLFATVYDDGEFFNDLDPVNYGAGKHWVAVV